MSFKKIECNHSLPSVMMAYGKQLSSAIGGGYIRTLISA